MKEANRGFRMGSLEIMLKIKIRKINSKVYPSVKLEFFNFKIVISFLLVVSLASGKLRWPALQQISTRGKIFLSCIFLFFIHF